MLLFKLLILLGFVSLLAARNQIPELSLSKSSSFKLRTFMSHVVDGAPTRYRYQFDESYSSEQKRSVIKYRALGQGRDEALRKASVPYAGTIFMDGPTKPPLVVYNSFVDVLRCKELDWWKVKQLLQIDVVKSLSRDNQILDQDETRVHGPSNLLFWFESIRDELQPVTTGLGVEVRGIPSLMFKHPFTGNVSAQTYAYYAKSQVGISGKGLPLRITIDYDHGMFLQYDFHTSSEMGVERGVSQAGVGEYLLKDLNFDEFAIPRAAGCSAAGSHSDIASLSRLTSSQESFSLTVQLSRSFGQLDTVQQVVYDKRLNSMRLDQESSSERLNTVLDFELGRTQRVRIKRAKSDVYPDNPELILAITMRDSDETNCVVIKSPKMEANMNMMLFGSKGGNWLYLGLAKVRGMRARVFELYDSEWPIWLQQPVSYARDWNTDQEDDVHEGSNTPVLKLNTVVYIRDDGNFLEVPEGDSGQLIGLEIFIMNVNTNKIVGTVPLSVSDFSWRVDRMGDWSRMSDVFSIADQCAASEEVNQHVRARIALRSDSVLVVDGAKQDLSVGHLRDLCLMEALQSDLGIPGTMIYDLRSTIEFEGQQARIHMSFLMAKSKQPLVRLRFYGKGSAKLDAMPKLTTSSATLAECYKMTAQRKVNTFFGYSTKFNLCTAEIRSDFSVMIPNDKKVRPKYFELVKDGPMDIYFVHHDFDASESSLIADLRDISRRTKAADEQLMKRLLVPLMSHRIMKVSFIIQSFQISDIYDKQDEQLPQISSGDAKKLHNFGLVPDSSLVKLHKFDAGEGYQAGQMRPVLDFASCQMACLLDRTCRTFSYCMRGSLGECALTSVDFGEANMVFQLIDGMQNQAKNSTRTKTMTLKVGENQEIRVKQKMTCELRQKSYQDLYSRSERELKASKLDDFVIQSTSDGREGCARQCFDQTEAVLPKLASLTDRINSNIGEILADQERGSFPSSDSIFEQQENTGRELCLGFFYLDALNINSLPGTLANRFQVPLLDQSRGASTGFCINKKTGKPTQPDVNSESEADQQLVKLEEFMFKFESTYERQPGLKLREAKKTALELTSLRKLTDPKGSPSEPGELESLKSLIDRRENTQSVLMTGSIDLAICARACTMQLVGPWPACRSFDMVVHPSGLNSTNKLCYLNSISYADAVKANRDDLISFDSSHLIMQTHYEPMFNTGGMARWRPATGDRVLGTMPSTALATIIISTLGSIAGLLLGVTLGRRVLSGIDREGALLGDQNLQIQVDSSIDLSSIAAQ